MKKTMTSINPPFSQLILDGTKKIEWRTKPLPLGWNELYETKMKGGCGKVVGQFEVIQNIKFNLQGDTYRPPLIEKGCVPYEFLVEYANGKDYLYANVIDRVERYDKPKELSEFERPCDFKWECFICERYNRIYRRCDKAIKRPPQSYIFVEHLGE